MTYIGRTLAIAFQPARLVLSATLLFVTKLFSVNCPEYHQSAEFPWDWCRMETSLSTSTTKTRTFTRTSCLVGGEATFCGNNTYDIRYSEKAGFRVTADKMVVTDSNKKTLFSSSGRETVIGSDRVILSAQAGVSVKWDHKLYSAKILTFAIPKERASPPRLYAPPRATPSAWRAPPPPWPCWPPPGWTSPVSLVTSTSRWGQQVARPGLMVCVLQAYRDVMFRARGHNSQFRIDAGTILLPGLPTLARSVQCSQGWQLLFLF